MVHWRQAGGRRFHPRWSEAAARCGFCSFGGARYARTYRKRLRPDPGATYRSQFAEQAVADLDRGGRGHPHRRRRSPLLPAHAQIAGSWKQHGCFKIVLGSGLAVRGRVMRRSVAIWCRPGGPDHEVGEVPVIRGVFLRTLVSRSFAVLDLLSANNRSRSESAGRVWVVPPARLP